MDMVAPLLNQQHIDPAQQQHNVVDDLVQLPLSAPILLDADADVVGSNSHSGARGAVESHEVTGSRPLRSAGVGMGC